MIPKKIHQIAFNLEIDSLVKNNIAKLKSDNKNWEYHLHSLEPSREFIKRNYGDEYLSIFDRISSDYYVAKADFFRYLLMYSEGGVYLDLKSSFARPLDTIILEDDRFLKINWGKKGWGAHRELRFVPGKEMVQAVIISEPNHPYLKSVIDRVKENLENYSVLNQGVGKIGVLRTTGPIAYSLAIHSAEQGALHRRINSIDEISYIFSIYGGGKHRTKLKQIRGGKHYTMQSTPIVTPSSKFSEYIARIYGLFFPILRNFPNRKFMRIMDKISRRTGRFFSRL